MASSRDSERGKISPNSRELNQYKSALPALSTQLLSIAVGLMLGDVSLQANKAKTAYRINPTPLLRHCLP